MITVLEQLKRGIDKVFAWFLKKILIVLHYRLLIEAIKISMML